MRLPQSSFLLLRILLALVFLPTVVSGIDGDPYESYRGKFVENENLRLVVDDDGNVWGQGKRFHSEFEEISDVYPYHWSIPQILYANVKCVYEDEYLHTRFILKKNGDLWGLGGNQYGNLGDGTTGYRSVPVLISENVRMAAQGERHSMFLKNDGTLWVMGSNNYGQLGDGSNEDRHTPVFVDDEVVSIAAGRHHSVFLKSDGSVWEMGKNPVGQLGDGTDTDSNVPVKAFENAIAIDSDSRCNSTVILSSNSELYKLGRAHPYTPAQGGSKESYYAPEFISGDVATMSVGTDHLLFVTTSGVLMGEGQNENHQMGIHPEDPSYTVFHDPEEITREVVFAHAGFKRSSILNENTSVTLLGSDPNFRLSNQSNYRERKKLETPRLLMFLEQPWIVNLANQARLKHNNQEIEWFIPNGLGIDSVRITLGNSLSSIEIFDSGELDVSVDNLLLPELPTDGRILYLRIWWRNSGEWDFRDSSFLSTLAPLQSKGRWIHAGKGFTHFVDELGNMWARGLNDLGQLGDRTFENSPSNKWITNRVVSISGFRERNILFLRHGGYIHSTGAFHFDVPHGLADGYVSAYRGEDHSLLLNHEGDLFIEGDGEVSRYLADNVIEMASGSFHSLYLLAEGTLFSRGNNESGQLGIGVFSESEDDRMVATDVISLSAADNHSLFIDSQGQLWAMGSNEFGQLGTGTNSNIASPTLIRSGVLKSFAGENRSFFITTDGDLWGMGENTLGQLGDGTTSNKNVPVFIDSDVVDVSGGFSHTVFVKSDGSVWGMGDNSYNQISSSGRSIFLVPTLIKPASATIDVSTDGSFMRYYIRIAENGDWTVENLPGWISSTAMEGNGNRLIELNLETNWSRSQRVADVVIAQKHYRFFQSPLDQSRLEVFAGGSIADGFDRYFFIKPDGVLYGAGDSWSGELGTGVGERVSRPVVIDRNTVSVHSGENTYYIKKDGSLWGTGPNYRGTLGVQPNGYQFTPIKIDDDVVKVASGNEHTLYLKSSGLLMGIGKNSSGEFGNGTRALISPPVAIAEGVVSFAAGEDYCLFVKADNTLWGAGALRGKSFENVGAPVITDEYTLNPIQLLDGVSDVACGQQRIYYVTATGDLHYYQFGYWPIVNRVVDTDVKYISVSGSRILYTKTDNSMWGMNGNSRGQLGDGTEFSSSEPTFIDDQVIGVSSAQYSSLYVKSDGSVYFMGKDEYDIFGRNSTENQYLPLKVLDRVAFHHEHVTPSIVDIDRDGAVDLVIQSSDGLNLSVKAIQSLEQDPENARTLIDGTHQFQLVAFGDFDSTGNRDFVVRINNGDNSYQIRYVDQNGNITGIKSFNPGGPDWRLVGVFDQNKDGTEDLLWQDISNGRVLIWFLDTDGNRESYGQLVESMDDFRVVAVGDMDRDGHMDLLCQKELGGDCTIVVWYLDSSGELRSKGSVVIGNLSGWWRCVGLGDYDSDGILDVVWQNLSSHQIIAWIMDLSGQMRTSMELSSGGENEYYASWQWDFSSAVGDPATVGDVNGDDKSDLLWQNTASGSVEAWYLDGEWNRKESRLSVASANAPGKLVALADMNGDGINDFIWTHIEGTRQIVTLWEMNNDRTLKRSVVLGKVAAPYEFRAVGDMNSDGNADILWQASSTGKVIVWHMDGQGTRTSFAALTGRIPIYKIQLVADMNGDGNDDIIWQGRTGSNHRIIIWYMNGSGRRSSFVNYTAVSSNWTLSNAADYNNDTYTDLIWFNKASGQAIAWLLDEHNVRISHQTIATGMTDWDLVHW